MPLTNGGPHRRVSSPRGGGSTLTTVAPMSPSIIVQKGPERMRERSRTKTSSSGITDEIMDPTNHELLTTNHQRRRRVADSGRLRVGRCGDLATLQMVDRLLDLPQGGQRVDDRIDTEVRFAPVAPRRNVVNRHRCGQDAAERMHSAFDFLVFA